jgi:hypothetical protein
MRHLVKVTSADGAIGGGNVRKLREKALADALGGSVRHHHGAKKKKKTGGAKKKKAEKGEKR